MNRKCLFTIFLFLLPALTFAAQVSYDLPVFDGTFSVADGTCAFSSESFSLYTAPGVPELPYKELIYILPPNAKDVSLSVSDNAKIIATDTFVEPSAPILSNDDRNITLWNGANIENGKNCDIYTSDAFYPSAAAKLAAFGEYRSWRIAKVRYYPFAYNPMRGIVKQYTADKITLEYTLTDEKYEKLTKSSLDYIMAKENYGDIAENFETASKDYVSSLNVSIVNPFATGYMILTTQYIRENSQMLDNFVTHKELLGYNVSVITPEAWGGGTGDTAANNIRTYLRGVYLSQSIKYVLIIGSPNVTASQVPMKLFSPLIADTGLDESDKVAPSDMWYADLNANFDFDGDGLYGEWEDDVNSIYTFLNAPEVYVGRIPCYNETLSDIEKLDTALESNINYSAGLFRGDYINRALLSMVPLDDTTLSYQFGEAIKEEILQPLDMGYYRIYKETYDLADPPEKTPNSVTNTVHEWQNGYGYHIWSTHGNYNIASDVMQNNYINMLDVTKPSFVYSCSCLNAKCDEPKNMATALIHSGAATSVVAATNVSWYIKGESDSFSANSTAFGIGYRYTLGVLDEKRSTAHSFYANGLSVSPTAAAFWANHLVFNVFGDPSLEYYDNDYIAGIGADQYNALCDFYDAMGGDDWTVNTNWKNDCVSVNSWHGVSAENLGVKSLVLNNNNVVGDIPQSFSLLKGMVTLDLASNSVNSLPQNIGNIKDLTAINLANNSLTALPSSFCNINSLEILNLANNSLAALPSSFSSLSALESASVSGNMLSSLPTLPESISNFGYKYNMLNADVLSAANLAVDLSTQTIPPSNIVSTAANGKTVITWTPIQYTSDGGYYEIGVREKGGTAFAYVAQTQSKTDTAIILDNEYGDNYELVMRTVTPSNLNNKNNLTSNISEIFTSGTPMAIDANTTAPHSFADNTFLTVSNISVSAVFGDCIYVTNGLWGIKVVGCTDAALTTVTGILKTLDGERYIDCSGS